MAGDDAPREETRRWMMTPDDRVIDLFVSFSRT